MNQGLQRKLRIGAALVICAFLLSGCIQIWREGIETVCLLIELDRPAIVTIKTAGSGGAVGHATFTGNKGFHKICLPIPGSMPAETSPLTVTVYAADPAKPNQQTKLGVPADGSVGSVTTSPPTIPAGTTVH